MDEMNRTRDDDEEEGGHLKFSQVKEPAAATERAADEEGKGKKRESRRRRALLGRTKVGRREKEGGGGFATSSDVEPSGESQRRLQKLSPWYQAGLAVLGGEIEDEADLARQGGGSSERKVLPRGFCSSGQERGTGNAPRFAV